MFQTEGIETIKNDAGEITHLTIDIQKQQEIAAPILQKLQPDQKTAFQQECEEGYTVEEAREYVLDHLKKIWKK